MDICYITNFHPHPVILWAEGKKTLVKVPSLEALNELARDKLGWRDLYIIK